MKSKKMVAAIFAVILASVAGLVVYGTSQPTARVPAASDKTIATPKEKASDEADELTLPTNEREPAQTAPATPKTTTPSSNEPVVTPAPVVPTPTTPAPSAPALTPEEAALLQARTWRPKSGVMCTTVLTPARHSETGVYYTFPSGCIPPGWVAVRSGV